MWDVYIVFEDEVSKANEEPLSREDAITFAEMLDHDLAFLLWPSRSTLDDLAGILRLLLH